MKTKQFKITLHELSKAWFKMSDIFIQHKQMRVEYIKNPINDKIPDGEYTFKNSNDFIYFMTSIATELVNETNKTKRNK